MKDCKHKIFHMLCTVCWYKMAKGVFKRSSKQSNPSGHEFVINDPDDGSWVGR